MRELRGRTAVVTGAASGNGRALAEAFAGEGMADVEAAARAADAIRRARFWALTHPEYLAQVRERMEDVLDSRKPSPVPLQG